MPGAPQIQIRMPDGQIVGFPADMPKEEIDRMIAAKHPEIKAKSVGGFVSNAWDDAQDIYGRLAPLVGKAIANPKKGAEELTKLTVGPILGAVQKIIPGEQYAEKQFFEPMADQIGKDLAIGKYAKTGGWDPSQAAENAYNKPFSTAMSAFGLAPALQLARGPVGAVSRAGARITSFPTNTVSRGVSNVAKRAVTPVPVSAGVAARANRVEQAIGRPVSAGQYLNSPNLKWVEETYGNIDHTPTKQAYTRSEAAKAGIHGLDDTDMLDPQTLAHRFDQFEGEFNSFHINNNLNRTPQFAADGWRAFAEYARNSGQNINLGPRELSALYRRSEAFKVAEMLNTGTLSGKQYHMLRSAWAKASVSGENQALREYYHSLVEAIDDVAAQSMSTAERQRFANLRREYRNYRAVEYAMGPGGGADTAAGLLDPSRLVSAAGRGKFRGSFTRGGSDFSQSARDAKTVIGNQPPQTGSWPRNFMNKLAAGAGGGGGALAGAGIGLGMGGPIGSAIGTAIGATTGLLGQMAFGKAVGSRPVQSWLKNQAFNWRSDAAREAGLVAGVGGRQTATVANNRERQLERAEKVLSADVLNHAKRTPELRVPLNNWLKSGDQKDRRALADAIAKNLNVPQMAGRIYEELGGQ